MSKTDLLLKCSWPWGRVLPREEVGLPAHFGSAFHLVMVGKTIKEACAAYPDVDPKALGERVKPAQKLLKEWLGGDNPWDRKWLVRSRERSYAWNVETGEIRDCKPPREEDHVYPDRQEGEICGTCDLEAVSPEPQLKAHPAEWLLVLDYKTGRDPGAVSTSGQLLSLALCALAKTDSPSRLLIGYLHAPADMPPSILTDTINIGPGSPLHIHANRVRDAMGRIGSEGLFPGEHCTYCSAFTACPTQTTSLTALHATGPMTRERVGEIHQALAEYKRLADRLDEQVKAWVTKNGPAVRPDGKTVAFVKRPYSNLSQASIRRALPLDKAEKVIAKLRADGCIEEGERDELRAVVE